MASPERFEGSARYLALRMKGEADYVDVSGVASGLGETGLNESQDTREIPGGGAVVGTQTVGYVEGSLSFDLDENPNTDWLIGKAGRTIEFELGLKGNSTGMPKISGEGPIMFNHEFQGRGVRRFTGCTIDIDGLISRGTFA